MSVSPSIIIFKKLPILLLNKFIQIIHYSGIHWEKLLKGNKIEKKKEEIL